MRQAKLAAAADQGGEFERYRRPTRRDVLLQTMNSIVPWVKPREVNDPHRPKAGEGRHPSGWSACRACTPCSSGSTSPTFSA